MIKENILVDTLRISGFRGIQNLEITFAPMTVLIGVNNSGKTTLLKALGLALGEYGWYITDEDFFIGEDEKKATEIVVDIRIVPATSDGQRVNVFNTVWQSEFGDKIKAEANSDQYVAIRTRVSLNEIKGGFQVDRATMEKWPVKWTPRSRPLNGSFKIEATWVRSWPSYWGGWALR